MARVRNAKVAQAWLSGRAARSHNGNFSTDGQCLWSYGLLIGQTADDGTKYVLDCRSPHFVSMTTSHHVSLACRSGVHVVTPAVSRGYRPTYVFPEGFGAVLRGGAAWR